LLYECVDFKPADSMRISPRQTNPIPEQDCYKLKRSMQYMRMTAELRKAHALLAPTTKPIQCEDPGKLAENPVIPTMSFASLRPMSSDGDWQTDGAYTTPMRAMAGDIGEAVPMLDPTAISQLHPPASSSPLESMANDDPLAASEWWHFFNFE
jgi:hypothetical protein